MRRFRHDVVGENDLAESVIRGRENDDFIAGSTHDLQDESKPGRDVQLAEIAVMKLEARTNL